MPLNKVIEKNIGTHCKINKVHGTFRRKKLGPCLSEGFFKYNLPVSGIDSKN